MNDRRIQSVIDAARGSAAELLNEVGVVLSIGAAIILGGVLALAIHALFSGARRVNERRWIIAGGIIFPAVTLTALLVYSLHIERALARRETDDAMRIHVIGKQWWWEVRYEGSSVEGGRVVLANELHIPVGRPIEVRLTTSDVIHSFWVPALAGKVDMIPGRTTHLVLKTDEAGVHRGQCAEYCGGQHALMALYVVAQPEPEFRHWLSRQAQPARVPDDPSLRLGHELFFTGGCHACHTLRGTLANSRVGPDLTHVGGRLSLAAGALPNDAASISTWIVAAQDVKPGSLMPSMPVYDGAQLQAVSAWLKSLE